MTVNYKKIMVPLDGSILAAQALPHAEILAALFKAELILFRAVPDASSVSQILESSKNIMRIEERQEHFVDDATQALKKLVDEFELHELEVGSVVRTGSPAETIIDYVTEENVDLIVMTTHGRAGLARWVYGSVADKVLRRAPCPVFLVRSNLDELS